MLLYVCPQATCSEYPHLTQIHARRHWTLFVVCTSHWSSLIKDASIYAVPCRQSDAASLHLLPL